MGGSGMGGGQRDNLGVGVVHAEIGIVYTCGGVGEPSGSRSYEI